MGERGLHGATEAGLVGLDVRSAFRESQESVLSLATDLLGPR